MSHECHICGKVCANLNGLSLHVRQHGDAKSYFDAFLKKDGDGLCKCGKQTRFVSMRDGYLEYCSRGCRYASFSGVGHPMYGKRGELSPLHGRHHSEETKEKIASGRLGENNPFWGKKHAETQRNKWKENRTGEKHPGWGKRGKESPLYGRKGRVLTNEARTRISKALAEKYVNGKSPYRGRNQHGRHLSERFGMEFWYRSSYEKKALEIFEKDTQIVRVESEFMALPYCWNGEQRNYVPDFRLTFANGRVLIVEVKAKWEIDRPQFKAKMVALKTYCEKEGACYEVWTESELGIHG